MSTAQAQTIRRWVLTGSVAAITAVGALYGAGLKTQQEFKQEKKARLEATPAEQIEQLEDMRAKLVGKKMELQKKIDELVARRELDTPALTPASQPASQGKQQSGSG